MKLRSGASAGTGLRHRKIRIETIGRDGRKLSVTLEGAVTREKFTQLFELVELVAGPEEFDEGKVIPTRFCDQEPASSKFDKVEFIVRTRFSADSFSSAEVCGCFEEIFGASIHLSVVSTYLSRLCDRGVLSRAVDDGRVKYRVVQASRRLPTLGLTR